MVIPELLGKNADLSPLLDGLDNCSRVAIDTEFHPERRQTPSLYVVSIKPEGCPTFMLDGTEPALLEAMADRLRTKTWVLHGSRQDILLLAPWLGRPERLIDTQIAAGLCTPFYPLSLDRLSKLVLGVEPGLSATMSDWSQRPLTLLQRRYASEDVAHLFGLADALSDRLAKLGRSTVFEHAMQAYLETFTAQSTDWRSIRGHASLDGLRLAILQELVVFRDGLAAESGDRPAAVLGDGHILDLAKRAPLTKETAGRNRRFPRKFAEQHGSAIADMVQRVHRRPPALLPHTFLPGTPESAARAHWLAQAQVIGLQKAWAARLVVTETTLDEMVGGVLSESWATPLISPWFDGVCAQIEAMRRGDRLPVFHW